MVMRGDIVLIDFPFPGDYRRSKVRPALIIQNDLGNRYSSNTIVAAISTTIKDIPVHYLIKAGTPLAKRAGLTKDSAINVSVIMTVEKKYIKKKIGHFNPKDMQPINRILRRSLSL